MCTVMLDYLIGLLNNNIFTIDAVYRQSSYYGIGNGTVHLGYSYCNGNEQNLIDCPLTYTLGSIYCGYDALAGVFCPCKLLTCITLSQLDHVYIDI